MAIIKLLFIVVICLFDIIAVAADYVNRVPVYNQYPSYPKTTTLYNSASAKKKTSLSYTYFVDFITSPADGAAAHFHYYDYVDPTVLLPTDSTVDFFRKLAALNHLDKSPAELKAMEKLNKFLATNFKTTYLPGNVYYEKGNNIPQPIHVSELRNQSFDAVLENNSDAVAAMVNNFNILHIKNSDGYSLFAYAILYHKNDIARMLLYKGAYINEPNNLGTNPLAIAVKSNNNLMARELIKNGADPISKDTFGKTAYDYAIMNDNHGLASLIQKYSENYTRINPSSRKNCRA